MSLLVRLLDFARSGKAHEEDPITEILAYLLGQDRDLCVEFLAKIKKLTNVIGWSDLGKPLILTQHSVPAVGEENGLCRYDLLLRWPPDRAQLVVEVKVSAGLTHKAVENDEGHAEHVDQLQRYLRLADTRPKAYVVGLGVRPADVPNVVNQHDRFLGCLGWQRVYDACVRHIGQQEEVAHQQPARSLFVSRCLAS